MNYYNLLRDIFQPPQKRVAMSHPSVVYVSFHGKITGQGWQVRDLRSRGRLRRPGSPLNTREKAHLNWHFNGIKGHESVAGSIVDFPAMELIQIMPSEPNPPVLRFPIFWKVLEQEYREDPESGRSLLEQLFCVPFCMYCKPFSLGSLE